MIPWIAAPMPAPINAPGIPPIAPPIVAPSSGPTLDIAESAPFPAALPIFFVSTNSFTPLETAVMPRSAKVNTVPHFPNSFAPFEK